MNKKIKIIKGVCCNPWNLSHLIGDEIEIDSKQADELVAAGRAEIVQDSETTAAPAEKSAKKTAKK